MHVRRESNSLFVYRLDSETAISGLLSQVDMNVSFIYVEHQVMIQVASAAATDVAANIQFTHTV